MMLNFEMFVVLFLLFSTVLAYIEVEELQVNGEYKSPNCKVNLTCNIHTDKTFTLVKWTCYGGRSVTDISKIPGFTVSKVRYPSRNRVQQTIFIDRCYSKLELKCEAGDSSKSVTLVSGPLSFLGIVFLVLSVIFGIVCVCITICRRRKKRAAAKADNCKAVNLNPPPGSNSTQPTTNSEDPIPSPLVQGSVYPLQPTSYPVYPSQPTSYPSLLVSVV